MPIQDVLLLIPIGHGQAVNVTRSRFELATCARCLRSAWAPADSGRLDAHRICLNCLAERRGRASSAP
ncbi:hypothetical protein [Singulisphaera sp. PoT]|uniref:hypothetical protein n=1 Tax=Singulisphaera sp. PoT TaxID=3411797 RepID=UPI003BF49237